MQKVKLDKDELLDIVRQNKEKHIKEFKEAVADYLILVVKLAEENLELAKSSDLEKIAKSKSIPLKPTSYETSYIKAICMLELSVDTVIELEAQDFDQLVLDEWQWKKSFSTMNSTYKSFT
jgi:fibronectin type 3 domain-containing protein